MVGQIIEVPELAGGIISLFAVLAIIIDCVCANLTGDTIVTNLCHHEQLVRTKDALNTVIAGIDNGVTVMDIPARPVRRASDTTSPGRDHRTDYYR